MSFLNSLQTLLGNAGQSAGNLVHQIDNATGHHPQMPQAPAQNNQKLPTAGAPINRIDPQASSPIPSFMGNRYAQNPQSPEFRGVDPSIFGYPADNTVAPRAPFASPYNPVNGGGAPIQPPIGVDELLPAYTYNLPKLLR